MTAPFPQLVEGSRVARLIAQAVERERARVVEECQAFERMMRAASTPSIPDLYSHQQYAMGEVRRLRDSIRARGSAA